MTVYIDPEDRQELSPAAAREAMTASELGFQITCLVDQYTAGNVNDASLADVFGALTMAEREFDRRVAAPYADETRTVNGDVYVTKVRPLGMIA